MDRCFADDMDTCFEVARAGVKYKAAVKGDVLDSSLEDWYNTTNSRIPFKRINRGFYRFGETNCTIELINNKLMAKTEDGWNRGKFAQMDKFLAQYEPVERERMGYPVAD